jgi:CubicO group peptidase (beta-lactamase class C family)
MSSTQLVVFATFVWLSADRSFADVHFPGATWEQKPASRLGLDPDHMDSVAMALGGSGCIVKDGYMVHSWGTQSEKVDWLSSAKPVLTTLLMFALNEGKVKSADTPIIEFGWELQPKDRAITFRHLASMTSGYARPEPPGAAWAYNDFAIQLYQKTLFDRVFKEDPNTAANAPHRLGGLGLEDGLSFTKDRRRLKASARDFARIAWFWLNRGRWHDRQLIPTIYFDDLMRPQVPKDLSVSHAADTDDYLNIGSFGGGSEHFTRFGAGIYGGNWWFNRTGRLHSDRQTWPDAPPDTVMSIGAGGNNSVLMPTLKLVVVCSRGDWGKLDAGVPDSVLNQRLKLITWAGTPKPPEDGKPVRQSGPAAQ